MAQYRPDLLAPFLALPQGEKVQAECEFPTSTLAIYCRFTHLLRLQTSGSMAMAVSVPRRR